MPLLVRNHASDTTLFAKKGQPTVQWAPAGDLMGDDVQRCPAEWVEDIDFLNSVDRGLLSIIEEGSTPEAVAQIKAHRGSFQAEHDAAKAKIEGSLDRRQDRDLLGVECIGPAESGRAGLTCGEPVLVRAKAKDEVPPLCPKHESLAPNFYLVQQGSKGEGEDAANGRDGKITKVWKRTEMTSPQRSLT